MTQSLTRNTARVVVALWCCVFASLIVGKCNGLKLVSGAYVHIPFCRHRCHYCSFAVQAIGHSPSVHSARSQHYAQLLQREVDLTRDALAIAQHKLGQALVDLDTIYFGGGTPSLMSDADISLIVSMVRSLDASPAVEKALSEVTLEVDPGTFDKERLLRLSGFGINRLSMGVQSFSQSQLERLGRAHSLTDVYESLAMINASPFQSNFNIDVISALPNLDATQWEHTLREAAACGATHLSVYDLQIEPGTAFGHWFSPGVFPLPNEQQALEMYCTAVGTLSSLGFNHYEVSNYARVNGSEAVHNSKYWRCEPLLGLGLSASSLIGGLRFTRPHRMTTYEQWLRDSEANRAQFAKEIGLTAENFSSNDVDANDLLEVVMLSLRTARGLNLEQVRANYGPKNVENIRSAVAPFVARGLVYLTPTVLKLKDPQGFVVSNDIISSIFAALMTE